MSDFSFRYDKRKGFADMQIENGDFKLGDDLETATIIALFSDRRATDSEFRNFTVGDVRPELNRGWWGSSFLASQLGSGLWLLYRGKKDNNTLASFETYTKEALQWLIDDSTARAVESETRFDKATVIHKVSITKADSETINMTYSFVWDGIRDFTEEDL